MLKIKVLLVEDEADLIEMYELKIKEEGWEVMVLTKGEGVLELAKKGKPNIILLDIMLPGIDGFEILRELKNDSGTKKIPVLLLSNLGQSSDIVKGKKLGAADYLVKADYTPAQVVEKIKRTIKQ